MGNLRPALIVFAVAAAGLHSMPADAAPYRPTDDSQILERAAASPANGSDQRLVALRQRLTERPSDLDAALQIAQAYVERGRADSDPRYYGHAQAALAPWWTIAEPPAALLVLRATIKQHDHEFAAALDDLARAVRADPSNTHAWWTRAIVLQVRGDYAEARRCCEQLVQLAPPLIAASCLTSVDSLTGSAVNGYTMLRNVLAKSAGGSPAQRAWALTTLAEIAARLDDRAAADVHFRAALSLAPDDHYLLGAYADHLLDTDRAAAARDLLRDRPQTDALLLRLAIAEGRLSTPDAQRYTDMLRERFAAARLRGSSVHGREEARLALELMHRPAEALELARANWEIQREPADARILLAAAAATGNRATADPVLEFLARNRTEDVALQRLATALEAPRQ